jgi:hypothetical protein
MRHAAIVPTEGAGRFGRLRLEELIIWNLLKRAPDRVVAAEQNERLAPV